jgi:hypothetical protein
MAARIAIAGPKTYAGGHGKFHRTMDRLAKLASRRPPVRGSVLHKFNEAYALYWKLYKTNLRSEADAGADVLRVFGVKKQVRSINNGVLGASTNDFVYPHAKVVLRDIERAMDGIIEAAAEKFEPELEDLSDSPEEDD